MSLWYWSRTKPSQRRPSKLVVKLKHQEEAVLMPAHCRGRAYLARWGYRRFRRTSKFCCSNLSELATNLAVGIVLGTSFTDKYIQRVFPNERKVVHGHSEPVLILKRNQAAEISHDISEKNWEKELVDTLSVPLQTVLTATYTHVHTRWLVRPSLFQL